MNANLFQGQLVRLTAEDPQTMAEVFCRWSRDTEYWRLEDSYPAHAISVKATREWIEKNMMKEQPDSVFFMIRTLEGDRLIGDIGLDGIRWSHGDAFVGIGLGEREDWGKGYGTDAMGIILRYAFEELNLYRVSLNVFEYNPRALRCYEKTGFVHEGRTRGYLNREGRRWDLIFMGMTRDEWLATNAQPDEDKQDNICTPLAEISK